MHRLAGLITICAAFCAFFVGPAAAQQGRGDIFTVSGVRVDQSAPDAAQARVQALATAQRLAFERLARRLTSAEDQARLSIPRPELASLDLLVRGVDVEEERRSGTRYLGRFAVRFDPNGVRTALQAAGFRVLENRGAPVLVVPQPASADPATPTTQWRQAWEQGGYAGELLPVALAPASATADWPALQPIAAASGAQSVIVVTARQTGAALVADLVEFSAAGAPASRGQVSAAVQGGDSGLPDAYRRLAEAANARLQTQWKTGLSLQASQRTRLTVSALYRDMAEWTRLKQGLEAAAQTTISDIRIEAIAREGALVTFAHSGSVEELAQALGRFNLSLAQSDQGPVLRAVGR
ncbi:MAG: conserved exported protein of unknown function [Caulobacteraceae bacterium]|nr:MAG: conserved exported protein of unknown function [Caulobacteraceae bacterium]